MSPSLSMDLLRRIKLLDVFSDSELQQLVQKGKGLKVNAHSNIIIEGELTWGLYLLIDGKVAITKMNRLSGNSFDVGTLSEGSFFGEMSLIDEHPRSATVRAISDCQLFYLSKENFLKFLSFSSEIQNRFFESCIRILVGRLRELDDNYVISQYQLWKTALKNNSQEAA